MQSAEALAAALGMRSHPRLVLKARRMPLPRGMTFLLEVAVGDVDALREAAALTDHPEAILQAAAGFFIEQILLSQNADNYRTLGASRDASYAELRHHMALLMRWVHPDLISGGASGPRLDRSVYASRVTKAWEAVKTGARCPASNNKGRKREGEIFPNIRSSIFSFASTKYRTKLAPTGNLLEPTHNFRRPQMSQRRRP
jgi:hypothetical protein